MKAAILLVVFALLAVVVAATTPLQQHKPAIEKAFNSANSFLKLHNKAVQKNGLGELTVPCALCGIVVNEIEGFVAENISETAIINFIQKDICSLLSIFSDACDEVVKLVPEIIDLIEKKNTPSSVCINLKFCDAPFYHQADPSDVPTYIINLDLPANQRFSEVCSVPSYIDAGKFLTGVLRELLGADVYTAVEEVGWLLNAQYFPTERSQEIDGCAKAMGISTGWLALLNIGYEVSDACTSIVAQNPAGKMLHARNMDFWAGMGFTDTLKNITYTAVFQKSGKTVFQSTQFAGYVGILSGMRNNAFSVTINTRFYPQGPVDMFEEIIVAITEKNASLVSFLSRAALENEPTYASAVSALSNGVLIADVYYTIAGVSAGQGVVLSRNRTGAANVWNLAKQGSGVWYLIQTNYDHWTQPPWFDNRVTPAVRGMNALGENRVTLTGLLSVLSIKPVLNIQTTFSTMMTPADSYFKSYTRWCPYPCVE